VVKDGSVLISELALRCLGGDKEAWKDLIRQITPMIFTICHNAGLTRDESLDIFGQVCYLLLTNLNKVRSINKLKSFVKTTAQREILQLKRKDSLSRKSEEKIVNSLYADPVVRPDDLAEAGEITHAITTAMVELPRRCFELLFAMFFSERKPDYREISEDLDIPVASIGPTRARCLNKLMRVLKKQGILRRNI
jgi:RNA polymerase sigma factor (sigma-70 family)